MGRFGVGARVRDEDGDEGVIVGKSEKGYRRVKYDKATLGEMVLPKSFFTPVPANDDAPAAQEQATEWQPKVGDRVRHKYDNSRGEGVIIRLVSEGAHVRYDNWSSGHDGQTGDGSNNCWWDDLYSLELLPVAAPAPFAIKAGRFYVTRDGRKAGPMVRRTKDRHGTTYTGDYPWTDDPGTPYSDRTWQNDGFTFYTGDTDGNDLVAEWVEPAAAPGEPAALPATTDEVAVKVGDRVVLVKDGLSTTGAVGMAGVIRHISADSSNPSPYQIELDAGGTYKTQAFGPEQYRWTWASADSFVPEPDAPPAKFKVGDRVVTLVDWNGVRKGEVRAITSIDESFGVYLCEKNGEPCALFAFDEIEPAPAQAGAARDLKIGDRVVIARNSRGHDWLDQMIGTEFVIAYEDGLADTKGWSGKGSDAGGYWWPEVDLDHLATPFAKGTLVTLTTTARVSGVGGNDNINVVFADLPGGHNSFALPASVLTAA